MTRIYQHQNYAFDPDEFEEAKQGQPGHGRAAESRDL